MSLPFRDRGLQGGSTRTLSARLALAAFVLVAASAAATTYYVAPPPLGDDDNAGTSLAAPWATLQYAASQVGPGDVVLARAGDYAGFQLLTSGQVGLPITFKDYNGEEPTIVADGPLAGVGINVEASHVVIEGFTVEQRASYGIRVIGTGIVVRGNRTVQSGQSGIMTGHVVDLLLENNTVQGPGIAAAILLLAEGAGVTVRGNSTSGHTAGINFLAYLDEGGTGLFTGVTVEDNIVRIPAAATGYGLNLVGVQGAMVRNNLLAGVPRYGIVVWRDAAAGPSTGNRFLNNTVVAASGGRWAFYATEASTGTVLHNNIFFNDGATFGSIAMSADSLPGLESDRQLVVDRLSADDGTTTISLAAWRTATGQDATTALSTSAATFLSPTSGDYHLRNPGPAIDVGLSLVDVPADLEGVPRPQGGLWDIGAYEWTTHIFSDGFESGGFGAWSSGTGV